MQLHTLEKNDCLAERDLYYWSDVDFEGHQTLSRLRVYFPYVRSLLMDDAQPVAIRWARQEPAGQRQFHPI